MRHLSKPAPSAWCDGCCRAGWSRRPSRTHRVFGCEFQLPHLGKAEGNEIHLRVRCRPKTVKPRGVSPRYFTILSVAIPQFEQPIDDPVGERPPVDGIEILYAFRITQLVFDAATLSFLRHEVCVLEFREVP